MLSLLRGLLITDAYRQTFAQPNNGVAPKTILSFLPFLSWAEKTVDAAKICGGAENVVKQETQQTFVNGLLGFITLGIYTPLEARVYCSQ